jgi:hypothetical protein
MRQLGSVNDGWHPGLAVRDLLRAIPVVAVADVPSLQHPTNQAAIINLVRVITRYVGNQPPLSAALASSINQRRGGRGDWPYCCQQ